MTLMKLTGALLSSIVLTAAVATPAFAALGGDSTTVQADVARMKGVLRIASSAGVTVHEITTSYGTVVREYLTPGDKVFAISWRGPVNPDLRQMLGDHYTQYEQAASVPQIGRASCRERVERAVAAATVEKARCRRSARAS